MTRKDLEDIIRDCIDYGSEEGDEMTIDCELAADRILAAIEKEREGEERLHDMDEGDTLWMESEGGEGEFKAKVKGSVVFRPAKGKDKL